MSQEFINWLNLILQILFWIGYIYLAVSVVRMLWFNNRYLQAIWLGLILTHYFFWDLSKHLVVSGSFGMKFIN